MLIGISGHKKVGKDTFYLMAKERLNEVSPNVVVKKYAFADPVRDCAVRYFGVDLSADKESYRHILQGIGEMMREESSKTVWISKLLLNYLHDRIKYEDTLGKTLIGFVTDVRYHNEVAAILKDGGQVVRVVRDIDTDQHPSERELDSYEFPDVITNNGDLDDYKRKVVEWTDNLVMNRNLRAFPWNLFAMGQ